MHPTRRTCLAATLLPLRARADAALKVVVSFSILADFARQIGGPFVQVATLVPPGKDLHSFEPRPSDAKAIAAADLFVVNGLGIDDAPLRLARSVRTKHPPVIAARDVKPRTMVIGNQHITDPHAWQDVANASRYVRTLTAALAGADPLHGDQYQSAAAAYLSTLEALDAEVRAAIAPIPRAQRRVVTTHDALGYFGAAYGIDFLAPLGLSTDGEPSAKALATLINQVKHDQIRALFLENVGRDVLLETVSRETGVRIGGQLYTDALSATDGPAATYVDMIRHNTAMIVAALR